MRRQAPSIPSRPVPVPVPREMSEGALNVCLSNSPNAKGDSTMIDCDRCVIGATRCRDCVIAVTETRNVTGHLGPAELRALRVLADAGLVPPLPRVLASSGVRSWVFPDTKAS